jgi:tRNA(Ile)-lysidine synthetase-like protein
MSIDNILNFWFPNNDYNEFWFDKSPDSYIKENYTDVLEKLKDSTNDFYQEWTKSLRGKVASIIVLDQFTRNIYRNTEKIYDNDNLALIISKSILSNNLDKELPLNFRIFTLMPYRHQKKSEYLDFVVKKIQEYETELGQSKLLDKFKMATFQSYTNLTDKIQLYNIDKKELIISEYLDVLDPICKNYKQMPDNKELVNKELVNYELYKIMKKYFIDRFPNYEDRIIGISLSGGVDSMVILLIMKLLEQNHEIKKVYALHLEYINREEAHKETELIGLYCSVLNIPLYVRTIDYMNRTSVERNFYESETKKIRFNSYKYLIDTFNIKGFCLGHHHGDLGENVLMNIFNGRDILDLFVMDNDSVIDNVRLFRPLLNNPKSDIYYIAHKFEVLYLKDSTPDWSCRGVLRRKILPELTNQWGGVISNLAEIGEKSREWNNVVNTFVLKPIYNEIQIKKYGSIFNLKEEYCELPKVIWMRLFLKIFHSMGVNMISRKNLDSFVDNYNNNFDKHTKFGFSNGTIGIFCENKLYIFKNIFVNKINNETTNISDLSIHNFNVKISEITYELRNQITYENLINGYYSYTEQYLEGQNLLITNKFDDKDKTRKIFSKISYLKDNIPKLTSGFGFKPNKIALIEVSF